MSSGTVDPGDFYAGTSVHWKKLGRWFGASVFLSLALAGADLFTTAANVTQAGFAFIASKITNLMASVASIPVTVSTAAWKAPLSFLTFFGPFKGPVGLAIMLAALSVLWMGVLD